MIFFWVVYFLLSLFISFLSAALVKKRILKILIFSFLFSMLSSIWFKNPGENFVSPVLSIFLLETTILESNGLLRIIRPFAFFFFGTLLFCLIFWKRDFKN